MRIKIIIIKKSQLANKKVTAWSQAWQEGTKCQQV
jgi:hypothetical protein